MEHIVISDFIIYIEIFYLKDLDIQNTENYIMKDYIKYYSILL